MFIGFYQSASKIFAAVADGVWVKYSGSATSARQERRHTMLEKRIITSPELFGRLHEIFILHANEECRLRITGNNELILTK